jgi:hypothetical protein
LKLEPFEPNPFEPDFEAPPGLGLPPKDGLPLKPGLPPKAGFGFQPVPVRRSGPDSSLRGRKLPAPSVRGV